MVLRISRRCREAQPTAKRQAQELTHQTKVGGKAPPGSGVRVCPLRLTSDET